MAVDPIGRRPGTPVPRRPADGLRGLVADDDLLGVAADVVASSCRRRRGGLVEPYELAKSSLPSLHKVDHPTSSAWVTASKTCAPPQRGSTSSTSHLPSLITASPISFTKMSSTWSA